VTPHLWSIVVATLLVACRGDATPSVEASARPTGASSATPTSSATSSATSAAYALPELAFLPAMALPADNPLTVAGIERGAQLFGTVLGQRSCASCHIPSRAWGGVGVSPSGRHAPTLLNVGYQKLFGWDGRDDGLETRIDRELAEHHALSGEVVSVAGDPRPRPAVVADLASYVRSLRSGNAPFDRFELGERDAVSASAVRGSEVFRRKAGCSACHVPPLYTDHRFHNVGLGYRQGARPDRGRAAISGRDRDEGAFKTPSLRGVVRSPPYFHDASAQTLDEAIDYMLAGGHAGANLDSGLTRIVLDETQRRDLVAFLQSLDSADHGPPHEPAER
jgi:cytochrome c peroxidase